MTEEGTGEGREEHEGGGGGDREGEMRREERTKQK